jgi:hypothetical protein
VEHHGWLSNIHGLLVGWPALPGQPAENRGGAIVLLATITQRLFSMDIPITEKIVRT